MENETAAANIEQRSIIIVHCYQHYINLMSAWSGWDETNFLGRDRDQEIRLMKIHYETKTEKKWMLNF